MGFSLFPNVFFNLREKKTKITYVYVFVWHTFLEKLLIPLNIWNFGKKLYDDTCMKEIELYFHEHCSYKTYAIHILKDADFNKGHAYILFIF